MALRLNIREVVQEQDFWNRSLAKIEIQRFPNVN